MPGCLSGISRWFMDLANHRREFTRAALDDTRLPASPFPLFEKWLQEALQAEAYDPTAMVLSTVGKDGLPSSRIVLLKEFTEQGWVFFTNYLSRKGMEMDCNPWVSLLFFWPALERQVRIEGSIRKISERESDLYFSSRPENSQIAVWASQQSAPVPNRETLEKNFREYQNTFKGKTIPRPAYWGGYRVIPHRIEFWQGRENRLHDRIEYRFSDKTWIVNRLAP